MTNPFDINTFGINFTKLSSRELVHLIQLSTIELHHRTQKQGTQVQEEKSSLSVEAAKLVNEISAQRHNRVPALGGGYAAYNPNSSTFKDYIEFFSNPEKRTVVALLKYNDLYGKPQVWARGIAKCDPSDTFDESIGMVIALHRALGITVPEKFIK